MLFSRRLRKFRRFFYKNAPIVSFGYCEPLVFRVHTFCTEMNPWGGNFYAARA